jgi:hypothetical protein
MGAHDDYRVASTAFIAVAPMDVGATAMGSQRPLGTELSGNGRYLHWVHAAIYASIGCSHFLPTNNVPLVIGCAYCLLAVTHLLICHKDGIL